MLRTPTYQAYIGKCNLVIVHMLSMKVSQWNQTPEAKFNSSGLSKPLLKCADLLSDNTIGTGPVLVRLEDRMRLLIARVSDRQLKVAVDFETDFFTVVYMFVILLETHIMTETYAFLHTPSVLANCRQSMWGNSGVFGKSCLICRLDV